MDEVQRAAWAVYVSLHSLAAGHTRGQMPTAEAHGRLVLGDIDDVVQQLEEQKTVLSRADPELVSRIREIVIH